MSKRRLVLIEWVDSYGCSTGWTTIPDDVSDEPALCRSVGWIVAKGRKVITLVPHISNEDGEINCPEQGCGDMTIPVRCIKRITTLVEKQA